MLCATMLLAALLPAQVQVDEDYVPKVGDRAFLGLHVKGSLGERDYVDRAECYSTLENALRSAEAGDEGEEEGWSLDTSLDTLPDAYFPRAGTPVDVVDVQVFSCARDGKTVKGRAFKVRVLRGEFKNRLFFVRGSQIIRFVGGEPDAAPARPKRRRAPAPIAAPAGDLVLMDVASNPSATGSYVEVAGRVRNTSSRPLRLVRVTVAFEDASGRLVRTAWTFCEPRTIEPGGLGSFEVSAQSDARYSRYKLSFQDGEAAIPWVDRSGKDVHP